MAEDKGLRPERDEAAPYYFDYIDKVPAGDIRTQLRTQLDQTLALLHGITAERSRHRYATDKWNIREVVCHLSDAERMMSSRAFWIARGLEGPLPCFDQLISANAAAADTVAWDALVAEFEAVRRATLSLFDNLPGDAWKRRGVASGNTFSVRALAHIMAGHVIHHTALLAERYLS